MYYVTLIISFKILNSYLKSISIEKKKTLIGRNKPLNRGIIEFNMRRVSIMNSFMD